MITFIASILVFSIIVLVHEYGHYKVAKSVGIKIEEFAIGMGPILFKKIKNDTVYSIRLFPIGGFVRMEGEEEDIQTETSFNSKNVWQRFKVIAAGPLMNFALAIVIYLIISLGFGTSGSTISDIDQQSEIYKAGVRIDDKIVSINNKNVYIWDDIVYKITENQMYKDSSNQKSTYDITVKRNNELLSFTVNDYYRNLIGISPKDSNLDNSEIVISDENLPAYQSGIRTGDKIVAINNQAVNSFTEIRDAINNTKTDNNSAINIEVERNGEKLSFSIVPEKELQLGFVTKTERNIVTCVVSSFYKTGYYIKLMFDFIGRLFTGGVSSDDVGGPVQVITMIGETAKISIIALLNLAAFISINLGFMNLLPIPALDGSKLVFLIIEKIRGKKIPVEKEGFIHFIGFVCLIVLMVFITYKDIIKLIS